MSRTHLSVLIDDSHQFPPHSMSRFLDFAMSEGVCGKISVILAFNHGAWGVLSEPTAAVQEDYLTQVRSARRCGFDTHMELMTHSRLWDFDTATEPEDGPCEGRWLCEPAVSTDKYQAYFENIIKSGDKVGVSFDGVTVPGCDCATCMRRWAELNLGGNPENPAVWQALLNLARAGRFGETLVVPCFVDGPQEGIVTRAMAWDADAAVYDLRPDVGDEYGNDRFGFPGEPDPDYYISGDGKSGCIAKAIQAGASSCIFNAHWQGMNPISGIGWQSFQTVVKRIYQHYRDDVEWIKPSIHTSLLYAEEKLRQVDKSSPT